MEHLQIRHVLSVNGCYFLKGVLVLCTLYISQSSGQSYLTPLPAESIVPGGIVIPGLNNVYGNNVTNRPNPLTDAMKCWVDYETSLQSGILTRFYIYIQNITDALIPTASRGVRLQIWRPDDVTVPSFTLVYQQKVFIDFIPDGGAVFTYALNTSFAVNAGDRIGFTNEGLYGPISYLYMDQHRTYFSNINKTFPTFPTEGNSVTFDGIYLPAVFSIAVQLDTTTTTATTTTVITPPFDAGVSSKNIYDVPSRTLETTSSSLQNAITNSSVESVSPGSNTTGIIIGVVIGGVFIIILVIVIIIFVVRKRNSVKESMVVTNTNVTAVPKNKSPEYLSLNSVNYLTKEPQYDEIIIDPLPDDVIKNSQDVTAENTSSGYITIINSESYEKLNQPSPQSGGLTNISVTTDNKGAGYTEVQGAGYTTLDKRDMSSPYEEPYLPLSRNSVDTENVVSYDNMEPMNQIEEVLSYERI